MSVLVLIPFFLLDLAMAVDDEVDGVVVEGGADTEEQVALECEDLHLPFKADNALGLDFAVDVEVEEIVLLFQLVVGVSVDTLPPF